MESGKTKRCSCSVLIESRLIFEYETSKGTVAINPKAVIAFEKYPRCTSWTTASKIFNSKNATTVKCVENKYNPITRK
jgi:hypothetical protein